MPTHSIDITDEAQVFSGAATTNYGTDPQFTIGVSGGTYISYIKIPTPVLAPGETIDSATLHLYRYSSTASGTLTLHRVTSAWTEGTVTYETRPTIEAAAFSVNDPNTTTLTINVTSLLNSQHGIALQRASGTSKFAASDLANPTYMPKVVYQTTQGAVNVTAIAAPGSASGLLTDATGKGNVYTRPVTEDTILEASDPTSTSGAALAQMHLVYPGTITLIKAAVPTLPDNEGIVGVRFKGNRVATTTGSGSTSIKVYRITSTWSEDTVTYNTRPSMVYVKTVSVPTVNGVFEINLDGVHSGTNYGIAYEYVSGSTFTFSTSENATVANRPYHVYTTGPATTAYVAAQAITADATMPEALGSTNKPAEFATGPLAGSVAMPTATAAVESNPVVSVAVLTADADMPGGDYSLSAQSQAAALVASAEMRDATIGIERGPVVAAGAMTANARSPQSVLVNGAAPVVNELDDDYFRQVMSNDPDVWFRLNESVASTTAINRVTGYPGATYHNVSRGHTQGPAGRHSVHFDGTGYVKMNSEPTNQFYPENGNTLEFTMRTVKRTTFIMGGYDFFGGELAGLYVWLDDGRLQMRNIDGTSAFQRKGFSDLADGKWHHVVLRAFRTDSLIVDPFFEIWVDGRLEIRRNVASTSQQIGPDLFGSPDFIGGQPGGSNDPVLARSYAVDPSLWFVGDITEVVYYDHLLPAHNIASNYYAVMGYEPVSATAATASLAAGNAKGKGNQRRALYLYWRPGRESLAFQSAGSPEGIVEFDPFPLFTETSSDTFLRRSSPTRAANAGGYAVYAHRILGEPGQPPYRDDITDEQRIIDLEKDVDLEQFDLIVFKDWPDEGREEDDYKTFFGALRFEEMKERLLSQVRDCDLPLMVTIPRLAVDLGIVNRVEFCPDLKESRRVPAQGQGARGGYDYGAAVNYPWAMDYGVGGDGPVPSSPGYNEYKALFYGDTHKNNTFRVRALIDGLTSIPSEMLAESVWWQSGDPFGDRGASYRYHERPNGLLIGDEFVFYGTDRYGNSRSDTYNSPDNPWGFANRYLGRLFGAYATPVENVLSGTVVTTFGEKIWQGTSLVDNPYKDYATTIILEPGDELAGKTLTKKVFVNFTEAPTHGPRPVAFQLPPADLPLGKENAASRKWQYSHARVSTESTNVASGQSSVIVLNPDGSYSSGQILNSDGGLATISHGQLYPTETHYVYEMFFRGFLWLAQRDDVEEGDVRVKATALAGTAQVVDPSTATTRNVSVRAEPALGRTAMVNVGPTDDATAYTFPATARAQMAQPSKAVRVAPMTATAELVDNPANVSANVDTVFLFLHYADATLYLKEDEE